MIYSGGTIGMILSPEGHYEPFDFVDVESVFPELAKLGADIEVHSFNPPLDSSNIGPAIWVQIARIIQTRYQEFDGFVILHGSDTMAYTGSALSFMLEGLDKPVIITGSQLPIGEIRTDAKENLESAFEIAAHPDQPIKEVAIYFEYKLFRANRAKKVHADVFGAFRSPNFRPIAEAGVHFRYFRPTPEDAYKGIPFRVQEKLELNVALKKFFPGISYPVLEAIMLKPEIKGIVIESYGSGNLPTEPALIETIREGVLQGKIVVNITQCTAGTVDMGRYATSKYLLQSGVLNGADLTTEAAITKMMYLMGKYDDVEKVKYLMQRNIRGEMTAERAYST